MSAAIYDAVIYQTYMTKHGDSLFFWGNATCDIN